MSFAPALFAPASAATELAVLGDFSPAAPGESWLVAHTRPRCEKQLGVQLAAHGFRHFLPLVPSVRHYADGTKRFLKPLFPGYVFVCPPNEHRPSLYARDHVARLIPVPDEEVFLRQLAQVRKVLASKYEVAAHPLLVRGSRVRVATGPLRDLEGVLLENGRLSAVVVAMDVLQLGVRVTLPAHLLRAVA